MKNSRIADAHLTLITFLIEYYRQYLHRTTKYSQYTKSQFTISKRGFRICTIARYNQLCAGEVSDDYVIYHELLANLGIEYQYDLSACHQLQSLNELIFEAAEKQEQNDLINYAKKASTICIKHQNSVYYKEMYPLYQIIVQYYQNHTFEESYFRFFTHARHYIDNQLYPVLLDIACYYYSRINYQNKIYFDLLHDAKHYQGTSILIELAQAVEFIRNDQHLPAIQKLTSLETQLAHNPQHPLLIKVYSALSVSYHFCSNLKAIEYCNKTIDTLKLQKKLTLLASPYHNLGVNYLDLRDYPSSVDAFLHAIQHNEKQAMIDLVYLYECYVECPSSISKDIFLQILLIADSIKQQVSEVFLIAYQFYHFIFNHNDASKLDDILQSLCSYHQEVKANPLYFNLFFKHLLEYCRLYRKETTFHNFMKQFKS